MIYFIVTRAHAYTVKQHLETWGRDLRPFVAGPLYYEELRFAPPLAAGTYIFSDLERLNSAQLELAALVWNQLSGRPETFRLLNNPSKLLRRFDLLAALNRAQINRFAAHRIGSQGTGAATIKFPVFLRRESEHDGALSPLLSDARSLECAVDDAIARGARRDDLLAVEFVDVSDPAGVYRKFSAFRVADKVLPRHIFHARKWMIKGAGVVEDAFNAEELEFLGANPHEAQLQRVFALAQVDYGRIDYGVLPDGQVQVWEINTNPMMIVAPGRVAPPRLTAQGLFCAKLTAALVELNHDPKDAAPVRLHVPRGLAERLGVGMKDRALRPVARAARWLARRRFVERLT